MAKNRTRKNTSTTKPSRPIEPKVHPTNVNDVFIRLIDAFYNLGQSGNLALLLIFAFIASMLIVLLKLPPGDISDVLFGVGKFFVSEKFYVFPLVGALAVSIYALFSQRQLYTKEINRLTKIRKNIIHGIYSGELSALEHHKSSGFDVTDEPINGDLVESRKIDD